MAPTFKDFIQSHQFTFFVGQEGWPIVVHAAAIAATSQQLDALIDGGMRESATRCAKIEDVNVDDFIRFCEYAYRGDYTTPPWEDDLPEPSSMSSKDQQNGENDLPEPSSMSSQDQQNGEDDLPQQNGDDNTWGFPTPIKKKKKKKGSVVPVSEIYDEAVPEIYDEIYEADLVECEERPPPPEPSYKAAPISRTPLRTRFNSRTYLDEGGPKAQILQLFEPKPNTAVDQNFTPVLLAHARLYCFAHLRLVEPLKALTLDKLHKTLMTFKLFTRRVRDIIELARFAYSNPDLPDRKDDGTIDDLRKLVVEYIVCEIDTIGKCDEYVKYMEEGGEFVGDFWRIVRDYMV